MNKKQKIAVMIPLILIASMYPVFHSLAGVLSGRIAWYLGLSIYWLLWGAAFPLLIIGRGNILELIRPHKPDRKVLLLVAVPLAGALIVSFMPGMGYEKESVWIWLLLLSTPFCNGFFEEVLWRGVYVKLFPRSIFYGVLWPSFWFAVWHYAPGSIFDGNVAGLMVGAGFMGLYLSYLTRKIHTLWWAIVVHSLGGIIMIVQ